MAGSFEKFICRKTLYLRKPLVSAPVRIRATIRNFSEEAFEGNLQVKLFADQNETSIDEAVISVTYKASTQVIHSHHFRIAGPKVLHAEIQIADDLPQDNRRSAALNVIEQIKFSSWMAILRKNGYAEIRIFLSLPLLPLKAGKRIPRNSPGNRKMEDLIQATSLSVNEFNKMDSLSEYSLIVLANLQNLDSSKAKELEIFTENGGGVFVCSGNQMDINWYNDSWGSQGSNFLPMPIKGTQGNLQNELSFSVKISNSLALLESRF